jgi:multidrug efflux pump subunit AcrA (membrane-fusion protein)
VVQRDGSDVVFVVHDGEVERRAVSVGRVSRDEVEVTGGLDEGESVVVAPPAELADGARIKVR